MERAHRRGIATTAAAAALLLTTGTAHADLPPDELRATTDHYLFEISLDSFLDVKAEQRHADQLDWSDDACSYSPDEPLGYEFKPACQRHDFGYRNYELQSRFTEDNRLRIDDNFRDDMYDVCAGDSNCETTADAYYWAVRQFGASTVSTPAAIDAADLREVRSESGDLLAITAQDPTGRTITLPTHR
ncbi:phospholipase [Saccharopolyspora griseoalba]|uniref:Phospholipase n=1 Tax=Saccharopolyspora griseoalba TaxID=1431848 RepID=A0ABW2LFU4_9PSEU